MDIPPPPPPRQPRTFIDEEGPDKRDRRIRSTALEEANYAVCTEIGAGAVRHLNASQMDQAILTRALLFETYLREGHAAAQQHLNGRSR